MANSGRVFVLVLAAGESLRLGRPKQLLELCGKPLVCHVVDAALASPVDGVVVVTGSHASEVELELRDHPVYRVFNPQFALGQGASLAAGIRAIPSQVEAAVVLLADMPGVRTEAIAAVVDAWRAGGAPAVVARYEAKWGHPVLFDRSTFATLVGLDSDTGGRDVLRTLGDRVVQVPVGLPAPPVDVDTEDDWARMQAEWG